jgi:[glutamine synthetase] adenylyltransferase / [glutamine synthetase]-adenylyl-L-tyrosine phosphorylase
VPNSEFTTIKVGSPGQLPARNIGSVQSRETNVEFLLRDLPDPQGARLFLENLAGENVRAHQNLLKQPALLADVLALAAWSPLLATTLEQNPEYLSWLLRERADPRVRTSDELKESLARFALTNSSLNPQILLARFRRRELLRTYLHDIRRAHTLVETTEELSNLADAILDYALSLARQNLDNRYGLPRRADERGRTASAEFCVLALGKLGSLELNYASDIDLVFLYSDEGSTSGSGERGEVTNREYFVKLSETIARFVGQSGGEGAAYRVDLRLRPHGRDGALACSLPEAGRYYARAAQDWERQALIRVRAAAGSADLFARFKGQVTPYVFRRDVSVRDALAHVRLAKQKIDRQVEKKSGFNVKLGRGGIREIEFIAQALQLAHGGHDDWLRVSHTLVSLGRLAERGFITQSERSELSDAYYFLRMLEHRLQMEHGLQTHTVPNVRESRVLIARRMGFTGAEAANDFAVALKTHTTNVRRTYDRLFAEVEGNPQQSVGEDESSPDAKTVKILGKEMGLALAAARVLSSYLSSGEHAANDPSALARTLHSAAQQSLNPHRALLQVARIAASLEKTDHPAQFSADNLKTLVHLCGSSEFFAEMIAAHPELISSLGIKAATCLRRDHRAILRSAIDAEDSFPAELAAFRLKWAEMITEIGTLNASNRITIYDTNRLQTELAVASLNVAYLIARREMARRLGALRTGPRVAFFGLGRLGTGGVDYGSDLDILITYDSLVPSPLPGLSHDEAYARLAELMIVAISSITREGYLYRVDLRLRPHGKNGPLVLSSEGFLDYLREKSAPWEWLAYLKLRAVGGDLELGKMIETHARHRIHENALRLDKEELKTAARHVRERLEREKGTRGKQTGTDIKYGPGGMLDVYFAARYLQLRDEVPDEGEDRSTAFTLERLRAEGALSEDDYAALSAGYGLLRAVDHNLRLIVGRSTRLPDPNHPTAKDVATKMGFGSAPALLETLSEQMRAIREAYNRILT